MTGTVAWDALHRGAEEAMARAYAPYSGYPVGAALRCEDGTVVLGCNVENIAFPAGTCAERTAVGAALAMGKGGFTHLALATRGPEVASPCGTCRQVLMEFAPTLEIQSRVPDGRVATWRLADLLPVPFHVGRLRRDA